MTRRCGFENRVKFNVLIQQNNFFMKKPLLIYTSVTVAPLIQKFCSKAMTVTLSDPVLYRYKQITLTFEKSLKYSSHGWGENHQDCIGDTELNRFVEFFSLSLGKNFMSCLYFSKFLSLSMRKVFIRRLVLLVNEVVLLQRDVILNYMF